MPFVASGNFKTALLTYYTNNMQGNILRLLNVCLQAADQNSIASLPKQQRVDKLRWENDPDFLQAIEKYKSEYVTDLNEKILLVSVPIVEELNRKEADEILPVHDQYSRMQKHDRFSAEDDD